ncbi:MAG: carboxypeptidase regulatory-like domain-containing protein [Planctomycetota bacterium]
MQKQLALAFAIAAAVFFVTMRSVSSSAVESTTSRLAVEVTADAGTRTKSLPETRDDEQSRQRTAAMTFSERNESPSLGVDHSMHSTLALDVEAEFGRERSAKVEHAVADVDPARKANDARLSISGSVSDHDKNPIAGVEVYVRELGAARAQEPLIVLVTDTAGFYSAALPKPDADWTVTVMHPGHAIETKTVVDLSDSVGEVDFELRPSIRLDGSVVSVANGAPIPAASIRLDAVAARIRGAEWPSETVSDEIGAFAIDGLAPARYELVVAAAGFESSRVPVSLHGRTLDPVRIALQPARTQLGCVIDKNGVPVAGADIYVRSARADARKVDTSAADGTFTISEMGNASVTVQIHKPGFATWTRTVGWSAERWEIVLMAGLEVRGRVIDAETGEPIAGADICAAPGARVAADVEGGRTQVAADGAFILPGLAPGEWTIVVSSPNYPAQQWTLELESSVERNFALDPGSVIRGRVVDADGEGLARVAVQLSSIDDGGAPDLHRVVSDHAGYFVARGLAADRYRLALTHRDYARLVVEMVPGEGAREWQLSRAAGLTGTVRDVRGRPGAGQVSVEEVSGAFTTQTAIGMSGRFALSELPAGDYRVTLRPSGGARPIELETIALSPATIVSRDYRLGE